jgi:hypothetical protein
MRGNVTAEGGVGGQKGPEHKEAREKSDGLKITNEIAIRAAR